MKPLTVFSGIFVGILFIISGFIKANDPLGFSYKLDEYFTVFGTPWFQNISLFLAMFICVLEIVLGVAVLIGYRMILVSWLLLLLILFFTFLTFYSAWFDVVKDCGCFGDALHLKPWESFGKDIILLVFILIIFISRKKIKLLFSARSSSVITIVSFLLSAGFTYGCYTHLPWIDFRPYAIGKNIQEGMMIPEGAPLDSVVMVFKYKKGEQVFEFFADKLPEDIDAYEFVDRIDKVVREGYQPPIHDFAIEAADGSDYTEDFLNRDEYMFMLVAYDLSKTNTKVQAKINEFVSQCNADSILFFGLTSTGPSETDQFRHEHQSMFDYYTCDATTLKTIVRANPGLVLLKKGTVIKKWHYNDFPDYRKLKAAYNF